MSIQNVLASVAVKDLNKAEAWYTRVLGRAPDGKPMPEVVEWKFPRGGWLQVYQEPERAGHGSCTLAVDDLDEQVARLSALPIDLSQRSESPAMRTLMISDPDGNHIAWAQALEPGFAA
ncbi:MAG: VOC family protein [Rubrivivax sp.]|nr:MAG: VOC family protein [Rubrivivax sp.]